MASGEWRVASGEWRVASGEWRVASGEWRARWLVSVAAVTALHRRCLQLVEPTDRRDACAPLQKSKDYCFFSVLSVSSVVKFL